MNPIVTTRRVDELLDELADVVARARLGHIAVAGTLTDWRTHRYGTASAELVVGNPPTSRLRLAANKPTAHAIGQVFDEADYDPAQPVNVTAYGHVQVDARWGLRLQLARLEFANPGKQAGTPREVGGGNHAVRWPAHIETIGLVDPEHGDDARADVLAVLVDCDLTIIEHRVPVTGRDAPLRISRALDQLGRDHRPDLVLVVRGGGADIDLDTFNHTIVTAAIARHPRPVIVGIGHATNTTRSDHAAHTSCTTPSAAATLIRDRLATGVRL